MPEDDDGFFCWPCSCSTQCGTFANDQATGCHRRCLGERVSPPLPRRKGNPTRFQGEPSKGQPYTSQMLLAGAGVVAAASTVAVAQGHLNQSHHWLQLSCACGRCAQLRCGRWAFLRFSTMNSVSSLLRLLSKELISESHTAPFTSSS